MRLHELFFDSISSTKTSFEVENLAKVFSENFGSFEAWKKDFYNQCAIRGMGWSMLVHDKRTGKFFNTWVNEHDAGMLADVKIILNIDMFEHAYFKDFGTDRVSYIDSIFEHLDWQVLESRTK